MAETKDYELPITDTSKSSKSPSYGFESTITVGDTYAMPRAGKTSDYFTAADRKNNPKVK